nr:hypothetical protein [uncultured Flavobacterium sp.]
MKALRHIFDFYLNSSIHVALAAAALVQMTYYFAKLRPDFFVTLFVFLGTLVSYNVIKYGSYVVNNKQYKITLKGIILITFLSGIGCFYLFFKMSFYAQLTILFFGILSFLYLIPLGKNHENLRNFAGVKIYIVSFCWAGVTILIPLLNADFPLEYDLIFKFLQRFTLTLTLILIFEINDLKHDDIRLKTVPQIIGISKTKKYIYLLLVTFYGLEFFKTNLHTNQWLVNLILVSVIFLFGYFVTLSKSKYYTLFWVESMPIIWYLLVLIC